MTKKTENIEEQERKRCNEIMHPHNQEEFWVESKQKLMARGSQIP